jgi:hypothetical protein
MDIREIIDAINIEIKTRDSHKFGIKVSEALFKELYKKDLIELALFSVEGIGVFKQKLPAYKSTYFIFISPDLEGLSFEVGKPHL